MRIISFLPIVLACCAPAQETAKPAQERTDPLVVEPPAGVVIEPSGYATILSAPPVPYSDAPPPAQRGEGPAEQLAREAGISLAEAERRMNPDEETRRAAIALHERLEREAAGNYVGVRIVRDPLPRHVFQFRRNAVGTLARFTSDPRFGAAEGGVPPEELEPLFQTWIDRFNAHRLAASGSVREFEGEVEINLGVSRTEFEAIAAREGWKLPPQVRLTFAREIDPAILVPANVEPFIRTFPRADRAPGIVLSIANHGRIVLRDGCFRLDRATGDDPLVLFGRDTKLERDSENYLVVQSLSDPDARARIGEPMIWGGYPAPVEDEPGVRAIRAACGEGPIVSVGEPESAHQFRVRPWAIASYAEAKGLTLQQAWDEIKACWAREDARTARLRPGEMSSRPALECDSVHPRGPPPPPVRQ